MEPIFFNKSRCMQKVKLLFASTVTLAHNTSQNTNEGLVKNSLNKTLKQSYLYCGVGQHERW